MKFRQFSGLKPFLLLWSTQSLSTLGSSMTSFALIIWTYEQKGTAMSLALLSVCSLAPSVLFSFAAGAIADRWNKKAIMLVADAVAAIGSMTVLILLRTNRLEIQHLYIINAGIGLMNAFQSPASSVAVSLIVPKEQYTRIGGLQAFSGACVSLLTPALATAVLAFSGLNAVLAIDLFTFAIAFITLALGIRVPATPARARERFHARDLLGGIGYLRRHPPILKLILVFSAVNLLAFMGGSGFLPALILARTGGNETILGFVSSAVGAGTLAGSVLVTFLSPPKRRIPLIFAACGLSFLLCELPWSLSRLPVAWIAGGFAGNFFLPFLNANLTALMRTRVPVELHGRVFSARDTLQYATIPLGYLIGGALVDGLFAPLMAAGGGFCALFAPLVGADAGAGYAALFLLTGVIGALLSFLAPMSRDLRSLDEP